jgi:hypothetical protein
VNDCQFTGDTEGFSRRLRCDDGKKLLLALEQMLLTHIMGGSTGMHSMRTFNVEHETLKSFHFNLRAAQACLGWAVRISAVHSPPCAQHVHFLRRISHTSLVLHLFLYLVSNPQD